MSDGVKTKFVFKSKLQRCNLYYISDLPISSQYFIYFNIFNISMI